MRETNLAGIVALTMLTGCAVDLDMSQQSLDNEGVVALGDERCVRVPGDFTHPDPQPPLPPVVDGFDVAVFIEAPQPEDRRGLLQAELMLAERLVNQGAPLTSADIDVLIAAGDALRAYDPDAYDSLLPKLRDFNGLRGIVVPCTIEAIDAPSDGI